LMGIGVHPILAEDTEFLGADIVSLLRFLKSESSWWIKNAGGRIELISKSVEQAVEWLERELGKDSLSWNWGRIHRVTFPHALGEVEPLNHVFSVGPFPVGGDGETPHLAAWDPTKPYDLALWSTHYRQCIDMNDLSKSGWIHAPGQSGQLGSKHYDDLVDVWRKGKYLPMLWTRQQVEENVGGKLYLQSD